MTLETILDSGTGQPIPEEQMQLVTFGGTMEADTAIPRSCTSTPVLGGTLTFTSTVYEAVGRAGAINIGNADDANNNRYNGDTITEDMRAIWGMEEADTNAIGPGGSAYVDAQGRLHVVSPPSAAKVWPVRSGVELPEDNRNITSVTIGTITPDFVPGDYTVATDGTITGPAGGTAANLTTALLAQGYFGFDPVAENVTAFTIEKDGTLTITKKIVNNSTNLNFDPSTGLFDNVGGNTEGLFTLGLNGAHGKFSDISIDFSKVKNVNNGGSSTIGAAKGTATGLGTGRKQGDMIGVSIAKDGIITASYDNGMSKCLGQIATATFANASGLEKQGDNLYSATMNSGDFDGIGQDITANGGYMQSGVLEMSNVDLSQEFTEMITTQRGFQANSRIITVSDSLLEELTNLKR